MRPPFLKRWDYSSKIEGLLFFAQALEESLFDYTIDTFRPPALNTHYRCVELMHAINEVRRALLHVNTLVAMVEELALSLEEDQVAQELLEPQTAGLVQELRRNVSRPPELETIVRLILSRLRTSYRAALEERLKELITKNREKGAITEVVRSWLTQLMNEGFSAGHIFYSVTQRFFSDEASPRLTSIDELEEFFSTFRAEAPGWEVIFKVSPTFQLLDAVATRFSIGLNRIAPAFKTTFPGERVFLERNPEGLSFAILSSVRARDAVSARNRAERQLRALANVGHLHGHRLDFTWSPDALVYNTSTNWVTHLDEPTRHVLKRPDCPDDVLGQVADATYAVLERANFDAPSTIRLLQVLDLHASALKASTNENQLLNFWAAIETLLPPPSEKGRIAHIVRFTGPLLCRAYPVKLIRYLLDAFRGCYGGRADAILAKVPQGKNPFEKVAAVVAIKENEKFRDKLYGLCNPNPLLRYRLFWVYRSLCSAPSIRGTIEAHRRRVDWHVQRIYRSRNLILHAGETLPYLGSLIENAHTYLDRILDLVRDGLESKPYLRSLDTALLEVSLEHATHLDLLEKAGKSDCNAVTFAELLFGPGRHE